VLAVLLGDYGPWYFAWLVGTVMMVLVVVAGGALLEVQVEAGHSCAAGSWATRAGPRLYPNSPPSCSEPRVSGVQWLPMPPGNENC
jgi:hypothetical protein